MVNADLYNINQVFKLIFLPCEYFPVFQSQSYDICDKMWLFITASVCCLGFFIL